MSRPSPYRLDYDYWVVSDAASTLIKQGCTLSARHIKDGGLRMQFNREIAFYAKSVVDGVATGKKTPSEALLEMKKEQRDLLDQGTQVLMKGAGLIAGALQVATGASICYGSAGLLCVVAGVPLMAHGANNIYENGRNLWQGRSDTDGPVRKGYQAVAEAAGRKPHEGNVMYGTVDIGLSVYSLLRTVLKPGAWRLFRYVKDDYIRSYQAMGTGPLIFEIGVDMLTGQQVYVELEE